MNKEEGMQKVPKNPITSGRFVSTGKKGLKARDTLEPGAEEKWVKQYCSSCIWANCGSEVKVVDGVAVDMRGDLDHPVNKGTQCPRGAAQLMSLYNPYRIKAPMKRTNPKKGLDQDPGWVEISWEEAFDTVAKRLKAIRDTDPRKLLYHIGFASNPHESVFVKTFIRAFGTPNILLTSGPFCDIHYAPKSFHGSYVDRIDLEHCNYLVNFGRNIGGRVMYASGPGRAIADALERGMKLVDVDPRCSPEASKGEWVPIKPGTDMAMGLAMMHVILYEIGRYDVESLKTRTNAPYLINEQGDYQRDPETGEPLIWDSESNQVKVHDDETIKDFALEGEYIIDGNQVVPAFVKLKDSVSSYTPEWAEERCGVAAETIRRISKELVEESRIGATIEIDGYKFPYRPAAISVGRGSMNQPQGRSFSVLVDIINSLLGCIGVPGSILIAPGKVEFSVVDGMLTVPLAEIGFDPFTIPQNSYTQFAFYPLATFPYVGAGYRAILDPKKYFLDYDIEALFVYGGNVFQNYTDIEVMEAAYAKIPFTFTVGYHFDEPTYFCDILFPEPSHLERYQVREVGETQAIGRDSIDIRGHNYKAPVLDRPLYNTKQIDDVFIELADRCGFLPQLNGSFNGFCGLPEGKGVIPTRKYAYSEMCDIRLKALFGDDRGADYGRKHTFYEQRVPLRECYDYHNTIGKARVPIYDWRRLNAGRQLRASLEKAGVTLPGCDDMDKVWEQYMALPTWRDDFLVTPSKEFDMTVANWKISPRNLGLGGQDENVWLREIIEQWEFDDLCIQMNTATAKAKGLKAGDRIVVESQHGGKVEGVLKTTELIHPDVVGFPAQAGRRSNLMHPMSRRGPTYNQLLSSKEAHILADSSAIPISARVKVLKA